MAFGAAVSAKNSDNDFNFKASQKLFSVTNYNHSHLDELQRRNDDYKTYCVDEVQWRDDDLIKNSQFNEYSIVEEKMETFNINEPLDLRIQHRKF